MELRNHYFPEAELVGWREGNRGCGDMRVAALSGGVREPGMCGHSSRENRETSGRILHGREAAMTEATGKVNSRTPVAWFPRGVGRSHSTEEVDEQKDERPCGVDGGKDADQEEVNDGSRILDTVPD